MKYGKIFIVICMFLFSIAAVHAIKGDVWAGGNGYFRLVKFSEDGEAKVKALGAGQTSSIAVDPNDGSVWVASAMDNQIAKFMADGKLINKISDLYEPRSISINTMDGTVWVADTRNNRVIKVNSDCSEILHEEKGVKMPHGVTVNPRNGDVWIADTYNNRVLKLNSNGVVLLRKDGFRRPRSIAVDTRDNSVVIADTLNNQIVRLASNGVEVMREGGELKTVRKRGPGQAFNRDQTTLVNARAFENPENLAVDPKDGSIWVADTGNGNVVKLDENGQELLRLEGFLAPIGIAVDDEGNAYVGDRNHAKLYKISPAGKLLWSSGAFGGGQSVNAVALDKSEPIVEIEEKGSSTPTGMAGRELGGANPVGILFLLGVAVVGVLGYLWVRVNKE